MKKNGKFDSCGKGLFAQLRIFNVLIFFLIAGLTSANASVAYSQQTRFSISMKNTTIKAVLHEIEKQSEFIFVYNDAIINPKQKIDIESKGETIDQVMLKVLKGTNATYKINDRQIILFSKQKDGKKEVADLDKTESMTVSGTVIDEGKQVLPGVSVTIEGGAKGTITDAQGHFTMLVPHNTTLVFSYIGFKTQHIVATRNPLMIIMSDDSKAIDEIVVIGYGSVKKRDLTGSVSSLKEADFNKGLIASPTDMIQGRVSGVMVINNGGEPGAGVTVRVRGANSIRSGQDPLYVVDGIPLDITDVQPAGASTAGVGSTSNKNPLNFINSDDIESIDILKDASATAIYGSRGANGVVIVTTKKGKEGRNTISYSSYAGFSQLPKKYDVLSASEYNAARAKLGLASADKGYNTDWQDQIFRTSFAHNHSLSMSGGNQNSYYRASFGYMNQQGIINKTGMEKYSGRLNFSTKALNNKLTLEAGLTAARTNDQRAPLGESGGVEGDLLLSALKLNPTYPVYNSDGTFYQVSDQVRNPVAMIKLTNDNTQTDRVLSNLTATLNLYKNLNYKANFSVDQTKATRKVTQDAQLYYMSDKGTATISNVEMGSSMIENYLTYDFNINKNHKFNLLAGHSYQRFRIYTYSTAETGFASSAVDNLYDLTLGKYTQAINASDITVNELQSFFGRVNYNLWEKYLLTVNFRADGSTKFGANNKYGYFPSAALAWRMTEEEFIKKLNVFSNLKMRLGWGITGNQEITSKISQATLGSVTGAVLNGGSTLIPGYTLTRTPNPDLKWEKTTQYDWGVDFGFFGGRLSGTLDLYYKTTTDVQMSVSTKMPAPTATFWTNKNLDIVNKGLELSLNGVIISNKKWNWSVNGNFSTINNCVRHMDVSKIATGYPSGPGITGTPSQYIINNEPLGSFWGKTFLGFDSSGKSIFAKDANGNDIEGVIGHALPDFTYNFGTTIGWNRFDLSLNFNGVYGNDVYNNLANIMDQMTLFSSGWNTTPKAITSGEATNNVLNFSSRFIENGSYLRLSNATLGYNFKLTSQKYISKLRVYLNANNLFCITKYSGYDPEVNTTRVSNGVPALGIGWTTYPKARTITMGVNVEF
ncbi:TonB-dependent receptor [Paludibacter sp.]|uniref:TonB-dependent receptor n=1 Tax=Paludibacter sp. TaxID=1898105 RepID=UPI0025EB0648|nr:TonB-dependent receptor [Paludibacter sp.]